MSERPKRSRKLINYEEDTLHWVEQKEIHKALMRSLQEKESPVKIGENEATKFPSISTLHDSSESTVTYSDDTDSSNQKDHEKIKPKRRFYRNKRSFASSPLVVLNSICTDKDQERSPRRKIKLKGKYPKHRKKELHSEFLNKNKLTNKQEDSCDLRLTRLQSKLLEEAELFRPERQSSEIKKRCDQLQSTSVCQVTLENIAGALSEGKFHSPRKKLIFVEEDGSKIDVEGSPSMRVRAQRKFASNASPPQTRSNSPVKMHRQKQNIPWTSPRTKKQNQSIQLLGPKPSKTATTDTKHVTNNHPNMKTKNVNKPRSVFNGVPKTDAFLSYLCFRNTSFKVDMFD